MFRNVARVTKPIAQVLGLASLREREGVSRDFEAAAPRLRQRQTYTANYFTRTASDFRDCTWRKGIALENLNHLLRLPRRILHMPARMLPKVRAICVNAGHNAGTFTRRYEMQSPGRNRRVEIIHLSGGNQSVERSGRVCCSLTSQIVLNIVRKRVFRNIPLSLLFVDAGRSLRSRKLVKVLYEDAQAGAQRDFCIARRKLFLIV